MNNFEDFFSEYEDKHNCSPEKYECFEAGVTSRQDEVSKLQTEIDELQNRLLGALLLMEELNNENTVGFMRSAMIKTLLGEVNE